MLALLIVDKLKKYIMIKKAILASVASLLIFTSCFKSEIEIPPTYAGLLMYKEANSQNKAIMFCADLMYKLNILLQAREGDQSLESVSIIVGGEAGSEQKESGVKVLFSGMNVSFEEQEGGDWRVVFEPDYNTEGTIYDGALVVSTKGTLLSDDGASWSVDNDPIDGMKIGGLGVTMEQYKGVTIANIAPDKFWIYVQDFKLYSIIDDVEKILKSKWALDFYVTKSPGDYSFLGMQNSTYEITGSSRGSVALGGSEISFTYDIDDNSQAPSPLRYKYNDVVKKVVLYSGVETVSSPSLSALDPIQYPASEVTVVWQGETNGSLYYELLYNGHTVTVPIILVE